MQQPTGLMDPELSQDSTDFFFSLFYFIVFSSSSSLIKEIIKNKNYKVIWDVYSKDCSIGEEC